MLFYQKSTKQVTADQLTTDATKATITLNKFDTLYPKGGTLISILLNSTAAFGAFLKQYKLEVLDQIRDVVLHKKGNETLILKGDQMGESQNGSTIITLSGYVQKLLCKHTGRQILHDQ